MYGGGSANTGSAVRNHSDGYAQARQIQVQVTVSKARLVGPWLFMCPPAQITSFVADLLAPSPKHVFESATPGLAGVRYSPFAFATQAAAGTYYSFLCEAQSASRDPISSLVKMRVFQPPVSHDIPIDARPIIDSIETIAP